MMKRLGVLTLLAGLSCPLPALAGTDPAERICALIETHAAKSGLPADFFARLIWKESRFDAAAVSPAGAEGVAQFMPATARARGLADSFDIEEAIPASASYLAELRRGFGNLGLAAAAYNAGEARVERWLKSGGFLPLETEAYVLDILGEPAETFQNRGHQPQILPLDAKLAFDEACRKLPVIAASTIAMARIKQKAWGVQVAGNFRRAAAVSQFDRVRRNFPAVVAGREPVVSRVRSPIGRRGIYAVRIGADTRGEADRICSALRSTGGACVVMRNR